MSKIESLLDTTRHDAQELHKKISANMAKAEHATWAEVKAVQADVSALARKMATLATDQADAAKEGTKAAIANLEAAAKLVENTSIAAKDDVKHANTVLLDSAHKAAQSLSAAVADLRSKAAKAIAPKQVVA